MSMNKILSLSLTVMVVLTASSTMAKEFRFSWQEAIPVAGKVRLELNYLAGNVSVIAYDGDEIRIDAVKRVDAISIEEATELSKQIKIKTEQSGSRLRIFTSFARLSGGQESFWRRIFGSTNSGGQGSVDFVIAVPENCDLKITSASGRITVADLRGNIEVSSSAADIDLTSIIGKIDIKNSSGSVHGELLFGPVSVRQEVGEIDLQLVEGDIKVRSTSALVTILQERGTIDLQTVSGSAFIQTNLESSQDYSIETRSGSINIMIPATSSGQFEILTEMGDITTDIPVAIKSLTKHQMIGEFGYGGAKIVVTSVSGDVSIAQF